MNKTRFKRILVIRTDRMGDVVLTTPAIRSLRQSYPDAFIAVLISPKTLDLIRGNPYINEVLLDDREGLHKGPYGFLKLIWELRKKKFDLAINFHTKRRSNLVCFFAGIRHRVGYYNDKFGILLTEKIHDTRPLGIKHEAQYCLDVVQVVGGISAGLELCVPLQDPFEKWANDIIEQNFANKSGGPIFAIHPGASCPTKQWPVSRFAELIPKLSAKFSCHFVIIGAENARPLVNKIRALVPQSFLDLCGRTSVGQLASLLKRCDLMISNDSGPVHLAAAVGTPVISIFTRNQPGINPERWRPLGEKSRVVAPGPQNLNITFAKGRVEDPNLLELVSTDQVFEEVDALFKLC